jgi:hypothetical protein
MAIDGFPSFVCLRSSINRRRAVRRFYYKRYKKWRNTVKLYANSLTPGRNARF